MFKFVVLCAFVAASFADPEPGALIAPYAPLAYASSYIAPAATTITSSASSVLHAPYSYYPGYSAPYYPHFIKKRSAPLAYASSYITPSTYYASAPLIAPAYSAPLLNRAPYLAAPLAYSAPAHFIKKRSAPLLPSTYITPTTYSYAASAPLLTSTYTAGAPIYPSSPLIASPFGYSHFIKKRSVAPLLPSTYIAPTTYSYSANAPLYPSSYAAPASYIPAASYYSSYYPFIKK